MPRPYRQKKKASRFPAPPSPRRRLAAGRFTTSGLVGQSRLGRLRLDLDGAGLLLFGDLALQLDGEQAVGELRTDDLHMVGELEAALEVAAGDAAIEVLLVVVRVRRALPGDQKLVLLLG